MVCFRDKAVDHGRPEGAEDGEDDEGASGDGGDGDGRHLDDGEDAQGRGNLSGGLVWSVRVGEEMILGLLDGWKLRKRVEIRGKGD